MVLIGSPLTQVVRSFLFPVRCKFKIRDNIIFNIILDVTRANSSKLRMAALWGIGKARVGEHPGPQVVNSLHCHSVCAPMHCCCWAHPLTWMLFQSKSLDRPVSSLKMVAYLQCYTWLRSWRVGHYVASSQECVYSLRSPSGSNCASCNPIQPHHTGTGRSYLVQMDNASGLSQLDFSQ